MHSRIASSEVMSEINSWQDVRSKKGKKKKSNYHNSMLIIRKRFLAMRATSDGKNCKLLEWCNRLDWQTGIIDLLSLAAGVFRVF